MANGHGGARPGTGRKKGETTKAKLTLIDMAKGHAEDALQTLVDIAKGAEFPPASRVSAAIAILDRGYGKPTQAVEMSGKDGGPIQTQEVSAREVLASRLALLATRTGTPSDIGQPDGSAGEGAS